MNQKSEKSHVQVHSRIDEKFIKQYDALDSPKGSFFNELSRRFLLASADRMQHVAVTAGKLDAENLRLHVHSLKNLAGNVGAKRLAHLCLILERKAAEKNLDNIVVEVHDIQEELNAVQLELRERIEFL